MMIRKLLFVGALLPVLLFGFVSSPAMAQDDNFGFDEDFAEFEPEVGDDAAEEAAEQAGDGAGEAAAEQAASDAAERATDGATGRSIEQAGGNAGDGVDIDNYVEQVLASFRQAERLLQGMPNRTRIDLKKAYIAKKRSGMDRIAAKREYKREKKSLSRAQKDFVIGWKTFLSRLDNGAVNAYLVNRWTLFDGPPKMKSYDEARESLKQYLAANVTDTDQLEPALEMWLAGERIPSRPVATAGSNEAAGGAGPVSKEVVIGDEVGHIGVETPGYSPRAGKSGNSIAITSTGNTPGETVNFMLTDGAGTPIP